MYINYRKLNSMTRKDHFPLPFIDQILERLAGHEFYCFLDGYSGYNQIEIALEDQEKTTFTCPFGTFAYQRMPFGLYNAPADVDQPNTKRNHANDPLEMSIGPITRVRAKKLKEASNGLVQNIWRKMNLEGFWTFKEHEGQPLIQVQEEPNSFGTRGCYFS
jgi:hypothetical protein